MLKRIPGLLILTLIITLIPSTSAYAKDPTHNLLYKSEYVSGYCVSEGFVYDLYISNSSENGPSPGKPMGRSYVTLAIYDREAEEFIYFGTPDLVEFRWSMNHGDATLDVEGKRFIVEWSAKGATQVTREEHTVIYHGVVTWYVSDCTVSKSQGSCAVYYDGDVAEGSLESAGLFTEQIHMVPIL